MNYNFCHVLKENTQNTTLNTDAEDNTNSSNNNTSTHTNENTAPTKTEHNTNTLTDPQGNTYKTVKIGNQVWTAENLNLDVGDGCWCYDDDPENCKKYGRLYTWQAAKRAANQIPGWHLPTDEEWKELEMYLGMSKSDADDTGWRDIVNGNGTNSSGFSALPCGYRDIDGNFIHKGKISSFWSETAEGNESAWGRGFYGRGVIRNENFKGSGYSVRLVRD